MDELFERPHRRHIEDLNVVPILDMLVSVIFFLLLSTSLVGYTKLEVPPARVSEGGEALSVPPLTPKLYVQLQGGELKYTLKWEGAKPSYEQIKIPFLDVSDKNPEYEEKVREMVQGIATRFREKFPDEATLQIGMTEAVPYQVLISTMDGVREAKFLDVVLFSYQEAAALK